MYQREYAAWAYRVLSVFIARSTVCDILQLLCAKAFVNNMDFVRFLCNSWTCYRYWWLGMTWNKLSRCVCCEGRVR